MGAIQRVAMLTMSSREIADLVNSRHDSVKRTVERLAERGVIDLPPLVEYLDGLGRGAAEYQIGKRDSYVIVAQLSPEFTARLVDRWQRLEEQAAAAAPALPNFSDPVAAARAWADQYEQRASLVKQVEQQKPAVDFAHAIRNTNDTISIGDMARVLGIGQNRLFRQLRADHLLMADNRPYQHYIDRGYFRLVENVWIDADKEPHPTFKTLVTGRGQIYLQRKYGQQTEQSA